MAPPFLRSSRFALLAASFLPATGLAAQEIARTGDPAAALAAADLYARLDRDKGDGAPIQLIRARALRLLDRTTEARDCFRRFIQARTNPT